VQVSDARDHAEDVGQILFRLDVAERGLELSAVEAEAYARSASPGPVTVRHAWQAGESRRVICSAAIGSRRRDGDVSMQSLERYARRHRWDLTVQTSDEPLRVSPKELKLRMLDEHLDRYDAVLWVDADVVVLDATTDVGDLLDPLYDVYVTEPFMPPGEALQIDDGVLMLRAGDRTRAVLDRIGEGGGPFDVELLAAVTADGPNVLWLDRAWNSMPTGARAHRPRFVHFAGVPGAARRSALVSAAADALAARAADPVDEVPTRNDLPRLLNRLGLLGRGVEVGVRRGDFSAWILHRWQGFRLVCVDPWAEDAGERYVDIANVTQARHDELLEITRQRLAAFGSRCEIWRMSSVEAASRVADGSLDFVYLDARHDEASVTEDLEHWYPKLGPHGVFSGHDYLDGELAEGSFGVKAAVDRFFGDRELVVRATTDDAPWPSWFVTLSDRRA
jgi:hypothetical protein